MIKTILAIVIIQLFSIMLIAQVFGVRTEVLGQALSFINVK